MAQGLKTDAQGQIRFDYLGLGTYYFQETKAPEGYNLDAATKKALGGELSFRSLRFRKTDQN